MKSIEEHVWNALHENRDCVIPIEVLKSLFSADKDNRFGDDCVFTQVANKAAREQNLPAVFNSGGIVDYTELDYQGVRELVMKVWGDTCDSCGKKVAPQDTHPVPDPEIVKMDKVPDVFNTLSMCKDCQKDNKAVMKEVLEPDTYLAWEGNLDGHSR
jgi:hypothetical protein